MTCLILSLCNPLWLAVLIVLGSLSLALPQGTGHTMALAVAAAPMLALIFTTNWLTKISVVFNNSGPVLKYALLLSALLFFIADENYFQMISLASYTSVISPAIALNLLSSVISYASLATLVLVLAGLIVEISLRLVSGNIGSELSAIFEGLRISLFITVLALTAKPLLGLLARCF